MAVPNVSEQSNERVSSGIQSLDPTDNADYSDNNDLIIIINTDHN